MFADKWHINKLDNYDGNNQELPLRYLTYQLSIPHSMLKSYLKDIVTNSFRCKSGKRWYSYIVVHGFYVYFVKDHTTTWQSKGTPKKNIVSMIKFLINNIFIEFEGRNFQQTVGIPMGTFCSPLLSDLFLHFFEAQFIQELLCKGEKKEAQSFNYTFCYIDGLLNNN